MTDDGKVKNQTQWVPSITNPGMVLRVTFIQPILRLIHSDSEIVEVTLTKKVGAPR